MLMDTTEVEPTLLGKQTIESTFYGEWRAYRDEASKEEARLWLVWWKDYMVKKLALVGQQVIGEYIIDRDIPIKSFGPEAGICTLAMKLEVR